MCTGKYIGESTGPLLLVSFEVFFVVVFIPFLSLLNFFFIEAAAKPSAFVCRNRGVCVLLHALRYRPSRNIYIYIYTPLDESYARFAFDRWLPLPPPSEQAHPAMASIKRGVCREETWPNPKPAERHSRRSKELIFPPRRNHLLK